MIIFSWKLQTVKKVLVIRNFRAINNFNFKGVYGFDSSWKVSKQVEDLE